MSARVRVKVGAEAKATVRGMVKATARARGNAVVLHVSTTRQSHMATLVCEYEILPAKTGYQEGRDVVTRQT